MFSISTSIMTCEALWLAVNHLLRVTSSTHKPQQPNSWKRCSPRPKHSTYLPCQVGPCCFTQYRKQSKYRQCRDRSSHGAFTYSDRNWCSSSSAAVARMSGSGSKHLQQMLLNLQPHLQSYFHIHTTILQFCGLCPGQPRWAGTRRYILPSSGFSGAKWR